METTNLSKRLLIRLPIYLNYLKSLPDSVENVSATKIAKALELGDVLVRKDLAKISDGGRRKLGYLREELIADIEKFLDIDSTMNAVVVGVGSLGEAILNYNGFGTAGINVLAGFDLYPDEFQTNTGKKIYPIERLEDFCRKNNVSVGIITVPASKAQTVCDQLVFDCEVDAIWNFAPIHLYVPEEVVIQNENLAASVTTLRMHMKEKHTPRSRDVFRSVCNENGC